MGSAKMLLLISHWVSAAHFVGGGTRWHVPMRTGVVHLQQDITVAPPVRLVSSGDVLPPLTAASLEHELGCSELRLLEMPLAPQMDVPPPELGAVEAFAWVHIATTFPELATAKRLGAVTVWLNEQAAAAQDDIKETGFLAAAIISDFADAVCGNVDAVPYCVLEAQRAAIEKEEEEERRSRRDHDHALAEELKMRPVRWDALAADEEADPLSPFAKPAAETPSEPLWAQTPWAPTNQPSPASPAASSPAAAEPASGAVTASKFCIACGSKLPVVAKFCSQCGAQQVEVD